MGRAVWKIWPEDVGGVQTGRARKHAPTAKTRDPNGTKFGPKIDQRSNFDVDEKNSRLTSAKSMKHSTGMQAYASSRAVGYLGNEGADRLPVFDVRLPGGRRVEKTHSRCRTSIPDLRKFGLSGCIVVWVL